MGEQEVEGVRQEEGSTGAPRHQPILPRALSCCSPSLTTAFENFLPMFWVLPSEVVLTTAFWRLVRQKGWALHSA
jgi:hypothetical protein